jgi:hypothetical protein
MDERDAAIQARGRELLELASAQFPHDFDLSAGETWPMVAAALISRMVGTLRSILNQQAGGGEADAGADVRRLLEHAIPNWRERPDRLGRHRVNSFTG